MRGSPVIRFFLLAMALVAVAVGLMRVTSARMAAVPTNATVAPQPVEHSLVPFRLVLSAPATEVRIDTGSAVPQVSLAQSPIMGKLKLDPENPHLSLVVRWKNAPAAGEHRFAKLTLEAPGQDTISHVFDADGDIDDFLELPLPAEK